MRGCRLDAATLFWLAHPAGDTYCVNDARAANPGRPRELGVQRKPTCRRVLERERQSCVEANDVRASWGWYLNKSPACMSRPILPMHETGKTLRKTAAIAFGCGLVLSSVSDAGFAQASRPQTVEIYEQYGTYTLDAPPPEMHPIVLSIPEQFLYGSSKGAARNWGVNILTYYPSFSSPQDPANAAFGLKCAGICNGRILVSVANRKHSISLDSPNMADFIARTEFKWSKTPPYPSNVQVRDIEPPPKFDEAFERVTSATPSPTGDKHQAPALTKRTYLRKADSGHYDLAAICNVNQIRTSCILHFSLNCNPAIYVSVNGVDGSYLPMATEIKEKTDRFISAMIKKPSCT
jgi:hypothetical protein